MTVPNSEKELVTHLVEQEEDESRVLAAIPKLTSAGLHLFCCSYNWDSDVLPLLRALDLPQCDRATALAIYWLAEPDEYAGRESVSNWARQHFEVFKKAEARLTADDFINREIIFNVRAELGGIDEYWDRIAKNPNIPDALKPVKRGCRGGLETQ